MAWKEWTRVGPKVPKTGGNTPAAERDRVSAADRQKVDKARETMQQWTSHLAGGAKAAPKPATPPSIPGESHATPHAENILADRTQNLPTTPNIPSSATITPDAATSPAKPVVPTTTSTRPTIATPTPVAPKPGDVNAARAASGFVAGPTTVPQLGQLLTKNNGSGKGPHQQPGTKTPSEPHNPQTAVAEESALPNHPQATTASPLPINGQPALHSSGLKGEAGTSVAKGEKKEASGTREKEGPQTLGSTGRASRSGGGQKLEAASSGVSSGAGEPEWIADTDSGLCFYAVEPAGVPFVDVLTRYQWFKKDVLKTGGDAVATNSVDTTEPNSELDDVIRVGLALRLNVYGGTDA